MCLDATVHLQLRINRAAWLKTVMSKIQVPVDASSTDRGTAGSIFTWEKPLQQTKMTFGVGVFGIKKQNLTQTFTENPYLHIA